jgi:hypothetical protein
MYIVAIAWLYVTFMMALAEKNFVAGVMTFTFYGVMPLALLLWLTGGPRRRKRARLPEPEESMPEKDVQKPDHADTRRDQ